MAHKYSEKLSNAQRRKLKALAHHLDPLVQVGQGGLSEALIKELHLCLKKHELVKVRLSGPDAASKEAEQLELISLLPEHSHVVGRVGGVVTIFCEANPGDARIVLSKL